jgi:hypothetical protein
MPLFLLLQASNNSVIAFLKLLKVEFYFILWWGEMAPPLKKVT